MQAPASSYEVAEVQLMYKNKPDISKRPKVTESKDAYAVFIKTWDENKIGFVEQAKVLLLNQANAVLGICELGSGGVSTVTVDPKLVFVAALKANASSIILAHNHPSENLKPSHADHAMTEKLKEAGQLLDISVLDHLIVSVNGFYSFNDDKTYNQNEIKLMM